MGLVSFFAVAALEAGVSSSSSLVVSTTIADSVSLSSDIGLTSTPLIKYSALVSQGIVESASGT